jgi:hypothetical protein
LHRANLDGVEGRVEGHLLAVRQCRRALTVGAAYADPLPVAYVVSTSLQLKTWSRETKRRRLRLDLQRHPRLGFPTAEAIICVCLSTPG